MGSNPEITSMLNEYTQNKEDAKEVKLKRLQERYLKMCADSVKEIENKRR